MPEIFTKASCQFALDATKEAREAAVDIQKTKGMGVVGGSKKWIAMRKVVNQFIEVFDVIEHHLQFLEVTLLGAGRHDLGDSSIQKAINNQLAHYNHAVGPNGYLSTILSAIEKYKLEKGVNPGPGADAAGKISADKLNAITMLEQSIQTLQSSTFETKLNFKGYHNEYLKEEKMLLAKFKGQVVQHAV